MKYAAEKGSGVMIYIYIYIPSFIKTGLAVQKLIGGDTQAYRHTEAW
jgi:hypothetical protein